MNLCTIYLLIVFCLLFIIVINMHAFNTDYEYADGKAENSTTNLISKFSQSYGGDSVLSCDYSNGSIAEIRQNGELKLINKYSYDSLL